MGTNQDSRETVRRQPGISLSPLQIYFISACWIKAKLAFKKLNTLKSFSVFIPSPSVDSRTAAVGSDEPGSHRAILMLLFSVPALSCDRWRRYRLPLRHLPHPPPGLPHEEEGRGQLRPGREEALRRSLSEGPNQGVLRINNTPPPPPTPFVRAEQDAASVR